MSGYYRILVEIALNEANSEEQALSTLHSILRGEQWPNRAIVLKVEHVEGNIWPTKEAQP